MIISPLLAWGGSLPVSNLGRLMLMYECMTPMFYYVDLDGMRLMFCSLSVVVC